MWAILSFAMRRWGFRIGSPPRAKVTTRRLPRSTRSRRKVIASVAISVVCVPTRADFGQAFLRLIPQHPNKNSKLVKRLVLLFLYLCDIIESSYGKEE